MSLDFPNLNSLWARTLVETLRRKGVSAAVICPGSRSSPLAFAFAETEGIEAISVLDERSAAFFALGMARRNGMPVALVCTSGSAMAHFFPAVIEASESGVPLIMLTADRPAELRNCAAGQTIDQVKFFGGYARLQLELAIPENTPALLRYLRQTVVNAVERSQWPDPGPVHLNIPLRDPLPPICEDGFVSTINFQTFFDCLEPTPIPSIADFELVQDFLQGERGLILIGANLPSVSETWVRNVANLANAAQWPVLADGLNPARSAASAFKTLVVGYEFILRNPALLSSLQPERVLVIGELPICKPLRDWLGRLEVKMLALTSRPRNVDPTHACSQNLVFDLEADLPELEVNLRSEYLDIWKRLDQKVCAEIDRRMLDENSFFEGKLAWTLARSLPSRSALCVSNSMPPRDLEIYGGASNLELSVYSSRGANGIDGILSTALGIAHRGQPTFLLTGDLALLHDTNGALIARCIDGSLTIVLVNNSGGGIFEMLPVAQFGATFETYFATDQQIDFANWAKTYSIPHVRPQSWSEFEAVLQAEFGGVRLIELVTDRKADSAQRKRWFREIADTLSLD